ncbi:MAG: flagellar hook-basal body complex protein FliE [Candidatus Eisenbacteria bacterium]
MVNGIGSGTSLKLPTEIPGLEPKAGANGSIGDALGAGAAGASGGANFADSMKEFLGGVNDLALQSDKVFQQFVRGEVRDLHQVALAQQEAGIAVRLVAEMRDKLVTAYQEIMRMQM